jgi:hypothetical protein
MTGSSDFINLWFVIQQALARISTITLVKVISFTPNPGGGLLAGTVSVQPLVNQTTQSGTPVPHGELSGLPYFRLQAGASAVIVDPVANDIGIAGFADHDISSVVANGRQANPGSMRRFDMSDGIYFGGLGSLNGTPTQFLQMLAGAAGINITTPGELNINASSTNITGALTNNGVDVGSGHKHPVNGVEAGGSTVETGAPNE